MRNIGGRCGGGGRERCGAMGKTSEVSGRMSDVRGPAFAEQPSHKATPKAFASGRLAMGFGVASRGEREQTPNAEHRTSNAEWQRTEVGSLEVGRRRSDLQSGNAKKLKD